MLCISGYDSFVLYQQIKLFDILTDFIINVVHERLHVCCSFLPLANEVCEGYVFTPVCQSFCSQGWSIWTGTPRNRSSKPGTPPRPGTPPGDQVHPPGTRYTPAGAVHAGRYGQQASGTHPTGMHSFYVD